MTADLKLGLALGYSGATVEDNSEMALEAERLGYESVWTAEAYGSDVFTPLAWIGAKTSKIKLGTGIAQISARTPAALAMTAATLDQLSGGRLILGLGVSGPQVVEGWYGVPFPKPLARTREYVDIVKKILRREGPVTHDGEHYPLPYPGGTGKGKPLKLTIHPTRKEIPIWLAAEGPKNVALSTQICEGWLPMFYSPYRSEEFDAALAGAPDGFEVGCVVTVNVGASAEEALMLPKMMLSFYIGGMGAKDENFHLNIVKRMGFEDEALKVQELFMSGRREEAVKAVPDELADEISLCGPPDRIKERLEAWVKSPVTQLIVGTRDPNAIKLMADLTR
ncbi:MAG TPA: LLM class F420-dependent oxidoreductase [Actinomycetota bacterium]|nr:LLM class F420-dependent oxidoreductase [Actinomycetota bacterium]